MSEETAVVENEPVINVDEVGDVFIPFQDVIIRFPFKKGDERGVNKYASKKGKPMLKLHYEIAAPESGTVNILDDNMEFKKDASGENLTKTAVISSKQNTEYWMASGGFQDKQIAKLLALSGVGTAGVQSVYALTDGRLEGKAFKVRFGHKIQARKDDNGIPTGEKSLNGSISKIYDRAPEYDVVAAVE